MTIRTDMRGMHEAPRCPAARRLAARSPENRGLGARYPVARDPVGIAREAALRGAVEQGAAAARQALHLAHLLNLAGLAMVAGMVAAPDRGALAGDEAGDDDDRFDNMPV